MATHHTHSTRRSSFIRHALPWVAAGLSMAGQAQTVWLEEFDGGASTTGFWIDTLNVTDCRWEFAPDSVGPEDFSVDFSGYWPAGPGFDSSFVFLDSDACGGTSVVVDSYLYTAPFDASPVGDYTLHFTHQFRARLASFCSIQVSSDGLTWDEVAYYTGTDAGYPNPAAQESVDITAETAGSPAAQIRFQFNAGWDWWWALDSISVDYFNTIGMEEYTQAPRMRVFPNPSAEDAVQLRYNRDDATTVRITDMTGRTVLEQDLAPTIAVGGLKSGSYVVQVVDAGGRSLARTVLVRR